MAVEIRTAHAADLFAGEHLMSLITPEPIRDEYGIGTENRQARFGSGHAGVHITRAIQSAAWRTDPMTGTDILPLELHLADGTAFTVISYDQGAEVGTLI